MSINISNNVKKILHKQFFDIAKHVYTQLGAGHSEYIYHRAMEIELRNNNISYEFEKRVSIIYKDTKGNINTLADERIDLYIHKYINKYDNIILESNYDIIIELKAVINEPKELEINQLYKYKKQLNNVNVFPKYGILINFPQPGAKPAREEIDFEEFCFT